MSTQPSEPSPTKRTTIEKVRAVVLSVPIGAGLSFVVVWLAQAVVNLVSNPPDDASTAGWVWPVGVVLALFLAFLAAGTMLFVEEEGAASTVAKKKQVTDSLADTEAQRKTADWLFEQLDDPQPEHVVAGVIGHGKDARPAVLACGQRYVGWCVLGDVPEAARARGRTWDAARLDDDLFADYDMRPIRPGVTDYYVELRSYEQKRFSIQDHRLLSQVTPERQATLNALLAHAGRKLACLWASDEVLYPENLRGLPRPASRLVRDHHDAEEMVAEWIRFLGWSDARRTVASGDGGIDVLGSSVAAQVKFEANKTGRPNLQNLYGAAMGAGVRSTVFVCSAGYTAAAVEWADQVGMSLFRFGLDGGLEPVNVFAEVRLEQTRG